MKNIYIFFNWLSNRNSLKLFIYNWEEFNSEKFTLKRYSRSCSKHPEYWIDEAFSWGGSHEGFDFWEKCHYDWLHFCKHNPDFKEIEIAISIY